MPEHSKEWIDDTTLRVMTYKSGPFTFQLGFEPSDIQAMLDRVNDSQNRFNKTPSLSLIIDQVQEKYLLAVFIVRTLLKVVSLLNKKRRIF